MTESAHVLLVEDDEPLAGYIARHLSAHSFPTEVARSAEEAEARLESGLRPALILLDINLPGETGWGLLRGRAFESAGRPPVVIVSATHVTSARLHKYRVAGYLPKPFSMDTLVEVVERCTAATTPDPEHGGPDAR
jgi:two-component system chemotaxis response regulator CheY